MALTLDAELTARSTSGEPTIRAVDFFQGPYVDALHPGEILTQINLPAHPQSRSAFLEPDDVETVGGRALRPGLLTSSPRRGMITT